MAIPSSETTPDPFKRVSTDEGRALRDGYIACSGTDEALVEIATAEKGRNRPLDDRLTAVVLRRANAATPFGYSIGGLPRPGAGAEDPSTGQKRYRRLHTTQLAVALERTHIT